MIARETSEQLRALAFFCALLVVPIHCWSSTKWFAGASSLHSWEAALAFLFTDTLSRCAVPCFFVLSGFFLAHKFEPTWSWYVATLRRRFFTLYVPFVIWNAFYLCRNSLLTHHSVFSLDGLLGYNLFAVPGYSLFWYLQVILLAVILSPVWLPVLRHRLSAVGVLLVLLAGWLTGNFGRYFSLQLASGNFLWLFAGAFAAFHFDSIRRPSVAFRTLVLAVLAVAMTGHVCAGVMRCDALFRVTDKVMVATGVLTLFSHADWINRMLLPFSAVYSLSFFIYAMHPQGLLVHLVCERMGMPFVLTYFIRMGCGILVPIALGLAVGKVCPRALHVLTGGREAIKLTMDPDRRDR